MKINKKIGQITSGDNLQIKHNIWIKEILDSEIKGFTHLVLRARNKRTKIKNVESNTLPFYKKNFINNRNTISKSW